MTNDPHVVIGVDIGGTKVAAGLSEPSKSLAAVSTAIRGLFADASSQNQIARSWGLLEMKPVDFTYE
jgi:hypothetical protein